MGGLLPYLGHEAKGSVADRFLAGGLSYLSDLYGLACDNVVNFEVRVWTPGQPL